MNDPRHFDASLKLRDLLDQGYVKFVLELGGVRETGATLLGLLTTLTRMIRNAGGEVVLANVGPRVEAFLDEIRMDAYWDVFADAESAVAFLDRLKTKSRSSDR